MASIFFTAALGIPEPSGSEVLGGGGRGQHAFRVGVESLGVTGFPITQTLRAVRSIEILVSYLVLYGMSFQKFGLMFHVS